MFSEHLARLEKMAKDAGYESADAFVLENELHNAAVKVNNDLDRALLPQDLMKGLKEDDFIKKYSDLALYYRLMAQLYTEWELVKRYNEIKNDKK